jgi:hypothetical protein
MQLYTIGNYIGETVKDTLVGGSLGYLSVWAFTNLNPVAGFAFGGTFAIAGKAVDPIFNQNQSSFASQLVGTAIKAAIAGGATIGLGLATAESALTVGTSIVVLGPLAVAGSILAIAATIGVLAYLCGSSEDLQFSDPTV